MSIENKKTIEVYQNGGAKKYLESTLIHNDLNPEKAKNKAENLHKFIIESFSSLPKGANIFEIGSADGETAKFLQDNGFNITASDIADEFINSCKNLGLKALNFNLIEDDFSQKYMGIYCWRVFVHFTMQDFEKALNKIYFALDDNGIFIFNVMNRAIRNVDSEMVDFKSEFSLGAERYYHYFNKDQVDAIIKNIGFTLKSFHTEGGENNNKWLVYVLTKK